MVLESVIFSQLALFEGKMSVILDDDIRAHQYNVVKKYVKYVKNWAEDDDER